MKNDAFVSELHDIGKLVDKEVLKKSGIKISGQTFGDFDFTQKGFSKNDQPSSPNWYLQYEDKKKNGFNQGINSEAFLPTLDPQIRANFLLTKIADGISASVTRQGRYKTLHKGIYKLWNPEYYHKKGKPWAAFSDIQGLKKMFAFIDTCDSYQAFFEDYENELDLTPEDKGIPSNVTSLFTHLELSGKIFRVLKKYSTLNLNNGQYTLVYNGQPIKSIREACGNLWDLSGDSGKWVYRLVFCSFVFSQSLTRLQDLNALKLRTDLIKAFSEDEETKDYVLFFTDDYMCLFIPRNDELSIHELLKTFVENGLIIEYTEVEAELNLLTSAYDKKYHELHDLPHTNRYLKVYEKRLDCLPPVDSCFPKELPSTICDSCQLREGHKRRKEQVRECLCDVCYEIRKTGKPLSEYGEWDGKAAWMKITLDQKRLEETLSELFAEYINAYLNDVASDKKAELRRSFRSLAVQIGFIKDYKLLLTNFKNRLYEIKNETGTPIFTDDNFLYPVEGYDEFGIFKVSSGRDVLAIVGSFFECMVEVFPKCVDFGDFPIKLAISVAPVKYPYQEHWRFLSKPKGTIDIQSPTGRLTLSALQYRVLMEKIGNANSSMNHFLHRLTEIIESIDSRILVRLEVYDKTNYRKFPAVSELLEEGLTSEQILTFYSLMEDEKT